MATENTLGFTTVKKLSIASMKCIPTAVENLPDNQNELPLARIFGKVTSVLSVDDRNTGTQLVIFVGEFEGMNLQKQTVLRSGRLLLPKQISDVVEKAIDASKGATVGFCFELRSVKSANGYAYKGLVLRAPQVEDNLAELRSVAQKAGKIAAVARAS